MAIKIYCVTKERLTGLNHSGYFIFIDTFSTEQEDRDLHLFLFAHPGQLPDCFFFVMEAKWRTKTKQALRSSQTFSPWQPLALNTRGLRTGKGICSLDSFPGSFDPMVEDGL